MKYEILEALSQISREKNVDRHLLIETLKVGLMSAAKKRFGMTDHMEILVDEKTGDIQMLARRLVVEHNAQSLAEIELSEAHKIDPEAQVGSVVEQEIPFREFGRNAIQAAKQIVVQRVREAERDHIFELYQDRIGEIVTGTVQQVDRGNIIVNLSRVEAIIPWREQIRRERYRQSDPVRSCIIDVQRLTKGPQIILSRTHPMFLENLFHLEVPEIYEGIVEIKAVAREAGDRSKIAVYSHDERVDAVGACVGMKGSRVQAIVRELNNERIDIVPWSPDPATFVTRALSPARVLVVHPYHEEERMEVVVGEDQLSLAIGKDGQNVRLAAKLTGWNIDLTTEAEQKKSQVVKEPHPEGKDLALTQLPGVGPKLAGRLQQAGIISVVELANRTVENLLEIPGIGEVTAQKLMASVKQSPGTAS